MLNDTLFATAHARLDNLSRIWEVVNKVREHRARQYMADAPPQPSQFTHKQDRGLVLVESVDLMPER